MSPLLKLISISNVFFVFSGTWVTQINITYDRDDILRHRSSKVSFSSRANVTIFGQTHYPDTFENNTVTFTNNLSAAATGSNDLSGTVRVLAQGVKYVLANTSTSRFPLMLHRLYNLNIVNTFGKPVEQSQAIALSVQKTMFACYACQLLGDQDTLLANTGAEFYANSLIQVSVLHSIALDGILTSRCQGAVDFIFGREGSIWVTNSVINTVHTFTQSFIWSNSNS